jgi:hypothetical protein
MYVCVYVCVCVNGGNFADNTFIYFFADIATPWEYEWNWCDYKNLKYIKKDEWKHVQWFYDNCNWRNGWARGTLAVTSTKHGAPIAAATDPRETLYKLLKIVREYKEVESEKEWEGVYTKIVKKKDQVMRKGKEAKKKPKVVNWWKQ